MSLRTLLLLLVTLCAAQAYAAPAPFDLAGPTVEVIVTRDQQILPIAEVPNLAAGDRLWIKADLPSTQSAKYLLVVAFLSGSTNPPPESWFYPCKTWTGKCARDGFTVTVPQGAQQVLMFLAPATGGDFETLVSAVRGRPGAFVRTSQDLNQAALDRSRLQRYLTTIRQLDQTNPARLKEVAPLLARSLAIRVDEKCLDRIPQLQAPCLMSGQESLILNDGHSVSIVEALTSGPGVDLLLGVSSTPQAGYGYYSPYIGSVVDIARILDSFRTARYQYIPALAAAQGSKIALTLNAAPSFQSPSSVLVAALPAVERPQLPPLHAVAPNEIYCASQSNLVLPVEGAPLVFATDYAHGVTLSLTDNENKTIHLPAKADGTLGGYVVDTSRLAGIKLGETVRASLKGFWGFEPYSGPGFQLRNTHAKPWTIAPSSGDPLVVGRLETVHLRADGVSCVDDIMLRDPAGKELRVEWKKLTPDEVEVKLPLQDAKPGAVTLLITQYGGKEPVPLSIQTFSSVARLDGFSLHAGDSQGTLKGSRLDEVATLAVGEVVFLPGELSTLRGTDALTMQAQDAQAAAGLQPNRALPATATLRDGRVLRLSVAVEAPRTRVSLIAKSVSAQPAAQSNIQLSSDELLPLGAMLTFSLRVQQPATFQRAQSIEVATVDASFSTLLSLDNGGIRLENTKVAVATFDAAKAFGNSAFGPLQFRSIVNGVAGDWLPLIRLVRLPTLKNLTCPANVDIACKLAGSDLFLIESVAGSPVFERPAVVPDGFPGSALLVPRPTDNRLYLKLRDDTSVIHPVVLDVTHLPAPAEEAATGPATGEASTPPMP